MEQDSGEVEWLSVAGDLTRAAAMGSLLRPSEGHPSLVVVASGVEQVDAVTGTATRMRTARHAREQPGGKVMITLPTKASSAERFLELLSPLPDGVTAMREPAPTLADSPRFALVPATVISDDESAVVAGAYALEACDQARISEVRSNLVAWAVVELASNALQHAEAAEDPPVVAVTVAGRERRLEVAVTDTGRGFSEGEDTPARLAALPDPVGSVTPLAELLRRGAIRDIDVSLEVIAGTGRLRWTQFNHRASSAVWVPGTTVVARVAT